jgi:CAAX protease family protein
VSLLPLFVDSKYEVRSGWKFAAYSTLLIILFVLLSFAVYAFVSWRDPTFFLLLSRSDIRFLALNAIVLFIPAVVALLFMARVDHVPVSAFGVAVHDGWLRDFAAGLAVAAGLLMLTLAGAFLFGNIQVEWIATSSAMPALGAILMVLLLSALTEELVFRGYPLQVFMRAIGPWGAILLISSIFGLLHARNEDATALSTFNTIIAGVFLCRAYMRTRSIWLPFGIHIGWNAGLAVVLGYPVSGIETVSILKTHVSGAEIVLGGDYGPEGGIMGTVIFLTAAILIGRIPIGRVSPQVQAALTAHPDKVYTEGL